MKFSFKHEQKVWEQLAEAWTRVRKKPQLRALELAEKWKPGKILDIGCANGRNLEPFLLKNFTCYGIDLSKGLLRIAREHYPKAHFIYANAIKLPFPDNSFDYVVSFAVLHHLPPKYHAQAFKEIFRVLKPDGRAYIAVWNKLQPRFWFTPKETSIPWKLANKTIDRYYYFFNYWELKKLLQQTGFTIESGKGIFAWNLEFVVEKITQALYI